MDPMEQEPTEEGTEMPHQETTAINGVVYANAEFDSVAEQVPNVEIPLNQLAGAVSEGHDYWVDADGNDFGPADILRDWAVAQQNEAWIHHIESIKRADFSKPIWIKMPEGHVFDGVHRLTRAFIDQRPTILAKLFTDEDLAKVKPGSTM